MNDSLVGDGDLVFHLTAYNELFFHPELQTSYGNMPKADPKQRLIYLCICVLIILTAVSYIPFLNEIFNTAPISFLEWLYLICIPFIVFGVEEGRKKLLRRHMPERSKVE